MIQEIMTAPVRKRTISASLFILAVAITALAGGLPLWSPIAYLLVSLVTFTMYGADKAKAKQDRRRIPEATLHLAELLGGWPGALVAQQYFRHKTRKLSYRIEFWALVVLHVGVLAWFVYASSQRF